MIHVKKEIPSYLIRVEVILIGSGESGKEVWVGVPTGWEEAQARHQIAQDVDVEGEEEEEADVGVLEEPEDRGAGELWLEVWGVRQGRV